MHSFACETLFPVIRRINFELDATGWDSAAIDALSSTLTDFADVVSSSKLDDGECSLCPFEIPSGTQPIQFRPYRLNTVRSKQVDAIPDSCISVGFIQHSTSPWSSPLRAAYIHCFLHPDRPLRMASQALLGSSRS